MLAVRAVQCRSVLCVGVVWCMSTRDIENLGYKKTQGSRKVVEGIYRAKKDGGGYFEITIIQSPVVGFEFTAMCVELHTGKDGFLDQIFSPMDFKIVDELAMVISRTRANRTIHYSLKFRQPSQHTLPVAVGSP